MTPLDAALDYAARGWPAFPCLAPKNTPLTKRGFHDATTDPTQIREWWTRSPSASIGIRTGVAFDVLDIDHTDYATGVADLPACVTDGGPVVRSGGNKWHLYFRPTGLGRIIRFSQHCDWLGTDGYVIAPPSEHRSGGAYTWHSSRDLELTEAPDVLVAVVRTARQPQPRVEALSPNGDTRRRSARPGAWNPSGIIGRVATAGEGERNDTLVWAAWRIGYDVHEHKANRDEARAAVDQLHNVARMIGLDEREIERTITSGLEAGLAGKTRRSVA